MNALMTKMFPLLVVAAAAEAIRLLLARVDHVRAPPPEDRGPIEARLRLRARGLGEAEALAHRRTQAVDGEVRGQQPWAGERRRGVAAGGVDQRADHARMQEADVLPKLVAPRHLDLQTPFA